MQFPAIALSLLAFFASYTYGCAHYTHCKCHDSRDNLQNDWVTEQACKKYKADHGSTQLNYKPEDNHACLGNVNDDGTRSMNNCDWDAACKAFGSQYYQWCWEKIW